MFKGYCFLEINGEYCPPVTLRTGEEVIAYCRLHHHLFPEIRIVDDEDFIVAHVINHVLKVPQQDGTLKEFNLGNR